MDNILITNVGRRGYLVDYIKETEYFNGKVYVSDCDRTASGLYGNNDGYFILSRPVDDPEGYVSQVISLCKQNSISVVIPVIDPEIDILSRYKSEFANNGICVLVSSESVLNVCYSKARMNEFLSSNGYLIPKTYISIDEFEKSYSEGSIGFPVIVKPVLGSGSVDTYKVDGIEKLKALFVEGMMIQEFIEGQEYGVDTLNDFEGNPVRCVVKKKLSMRSGETDKALIIKNKSIQGEIIRLASILKHIGNLDCDVIENDKGLYVIDMNPRFGGGYPATHMSGVNYLELIMRMIDGNAVSEDYDSYRDGIMVLKQISVVTAEV